MTTKIISTTYAGGYTVHTPVTLTTVTPDGAVLGTGLYYGGATSQTVINSGKITVGTAAYGVYLRPGASSVTNASGGTISAHSMGVRMGAFTMGASTVSNAGLISVNGGAGISLFGAGVVTNSGSINVGSSVACIDITYAGTVTNSGHMSDTGAANGVYLRAGGSFTNTSAGTISTNAGIGVNGGLGTVVNSGVMNKVGLIQGGLVTNQASGTITSPGTSPGEVGIQFTNAAGTATNYGDISADYAVLMEHGGVLNAITGTITGTIYLSNANLYPESVTIGVSASFNGPILISAYGTYASVEISGLRPGITIDLKNTPHSTGDTVAYNSGTITLSNAGGTILAEVPLTATGITRFTAFSDGGSGTDIVGYGVVLNPNLIQVQVIA